MKESETRKLSKSYFDVLGICCSSEVVLVEKILKNLEGVTEVSVVVATKSVTVIHDSLLISPHQIVKALNQARLEASVRVKGEKNYQKKWPSPFAIGSGILVALSFLKYFWAPLQWLALVAVAVGVPPIVFRAVAALRNLTLDINILVLIAVAGSIVLHDYWEAGTIVFLFTIAEWLESRASHKATAAMSSLVNIVPPSAVLADSGQEVNVQEVKLNSILSVKAGETIPIDGVVVEGECDVDEKTLTGESFPVSKQKDSTVWAGTLNLNGYISVKTTALAEDCAVARMAKLVEDAQNNKSKTQRFIDKCAKYYTPAIVALSASLAIVPTALRVHNHKEWYRLALVTLVSACPCALVLSTPVAMCCALSKAATSGLLFKGAEYLETLAKIKIMAFDKTGTITRGEFVVTEFRSLIDGLSLNTLLYWVSSVESKSSHPMAAALVEYAQSNSAEQKPERVEHFQNFPGEGIYGRIDGMEIYVGNRRIASRAVCTSVPEIEYDSFQGKSVGYIFLGSSPAGLFTLSDVCRTGVKDAMKELKLMGIKTAMLTGDCYAAAKHVQEQLGGALDEFQAELLPENKATIIKEFQRDAPTAMIGDGINDAPALAVADIGISMGISGSALAKETGHVILMTNDIGRIPKAARLARRVRRKIIENMVISITTKAAIVALAIAGYPLVWAAVLADTGSCLLVILNSMLILRGGTHTHGKKCCKSSASSHAHHHHENKSSCCKSANSPQLCFSDIESQKKCTRTSCSSELCVTQTVPSGLNSGRNNHCADSIENKSCHLQPNPQCCSLKSKSFGDKNCFDSIHKKSCHSGTNYSKMSSSQCHSVTSSSSSCGNVKCSDKSSSHSHADHQTCMSKMCDLKSQSSTSCSRTCGNTKFSDTTTNDSRHSHTKSESCCSNLSAPAYQAAITGSRSCGNNSCPGSPNEHESHSHTNPVYEEKLSEQESSDLVREDIESNDHSHACPAEEHHHSKSDEAYSSCALEECCYSVQGHIADVSEPGSRETSHCHSTDQRCSSEMSVLGCQSAMSASKSCGYSKCPDVVDMNSCHAHTDPQTDLTEVCVPLCKSTNFSNSVSNNDHHSGLEFSGSRKCGNNKSTDSINVHGCRHSHANPLHDEDDLVQESSDVVGKDVIQHHAVGHACSNKEEHAKLVRKYCKHRPCHDVRSGCRRHAAECGPAVRSTINILRDDHHHHLDCSGRKVCSPLKKQRRVGGCCKSFRKECCAKNNHFAASLGGGLSEIVIE